jgi:hypothetical protein
MFVDRAGLEAIVDRAVSAGAWRERAGASIAARVRGRLTHTALVPRLLKMIRGSLAPAHGNPPAG